MTGETGGTTRSRASTMSYDSNLPVMRNEKIVASGHGITVSISLAEPVLFLEGFNRNDTDVPKATILRGSLHLKLTKSARIKRIYLKFKGVAQTAWPEGESSPLDNL